MNRSPLNHRMLIPACALLLLAGAVMAPGFAAPQTGQPPALEATEEGGHVKLNLAHDRDSITFSVWSHRFIPEKVAQRVFQRHFSTKQGYGRGLGTFSMKLFGEEYLKGRVHFETSAVDGTTFRVVLPRHPPPAE